MHGKLSRPRVEIIRVILGQIHRKFICHILLRGIAVDSHTLRHRQGGRLQLPAHIGHSGHPVIISETALFAGLFQFRQSVRSSHRVDYLSVQKVLQNTIVTDLFRIDREKLVQVLIHSEGTDRIFVIYVDGVRIVAVFAAHIDIVPHNKIIVEDIRHVPLKNRLHLLRRIVHIGKGQNLVYRLGNGLPDLRFHVLRRDFLLIMRFLNFFFHVATVGLLLRILRQRLIPLGLYLRPSPVLQIGSVIEKAACLIVERVTDLFIMIGHRTDRRLRQHIRHGHNPLRQLHFAGQACKIRLFQ